jgi:hypothetical protein
VATWVPRGTPVLAFAGGLAFKACSANGDLPRVVDATDGGDAQPLQPWPQLTDATDDGETSEAADGAPADAGGDDASGLRLVGVSQGFVDAQEISVAPPQGIADGDLLVVAFAHDDPSEATLPPGWSLLQTALYGSYCNGSDTQAGWAWKAVVQPEPAQYTFQWSASWDTSVIIAAFRGVAVQSVDAWSWATLDTSPTTTFACPALVTSGADLVVVASASWANVGHGPWTTPAGMNVMADDGYGAMFWGVTSGAGDAGVLSVGTPTNACGALGCVAFRLR